MNSQEGLNDGGVLDTSVTRFAFGLSPQVTINIVLSLVTSGALSSSDWHGPIKAPLAGLWVHGLMTLLHSSGLLTTIGLPAS